MYSSALAFGRRNSYITPVALTTTVAFPIFAGPNHPTISSYDGWRGVESGGGFDPFADNSQFDSSGRSGLETLPVPILAFDFAFLNENISLAKSGK